MTKYDGDRDSSVGSLRPVEDEVIPSVLISKALNCIAISDPEGLEILLDRSEGYPFNMTAEHLGMRETTVKRWESRLVRVARGLYHT